MHATTFFASAAALVSAVSAGTIPTFAKRYNVTEAWGQWQVTNLTFSDHPSSDSINFQVWWDNGYSGPVRCSASEYNLQTDVWHRCEVREGHADSFSFALQENWDSKSTCQRMLASEEQEEHDADLSFPTEIAISQDLYQVGAIAHLNGSAPLPIQWGGSSAGREGTADPFYVPVLSVSSTLPNGTTTAPEYSSRK